MGSQIFGNLIAAFLIGNIGLVIFFICVSAIACVGIALLVLLPQNNKIEYNTLNETGN